MRVCGVDIETSGFDPKNDQILEVGYVIKEFKNNLWAPKNLTQGSFLLWYDDYPDPMPPELYAIHKISSTLLKEAGKYPQTVFQLLVDMIHEFKVECFIGHNALAFDKPFICAKTEHKEFAELPWLDTKVHIQYPADCKNNNLLYLAAYHGFLNPFPHDALSDVLTMMRVLQHYDFSKIYARAKEPWITVKADIKFEGRELARARGYQWNPELKQWEKKLPESEIKAEEKDAPFHLIRIK